MFDSATIIIQYHLFLALALVVAGLGGILLQTGAKRKWLPGFLNAPEWIIIAIMVVVYVFTGV